ncbi:Hypothetical protein D9617_40g012670 [Elsinoe fawcettii]|nr:Hypothetical protein D9617_40g012670 [Elsinoe fawcettii]
MSRLLLKLRLWLGRKIYGELASGIVKVSARRVIKGPCHASEAEAMQFIQANTAIPLPRMHRAYHFGHQSYLEMELIEGEDLEKAWGKLSSDQKSEAVQVVVSFVSQMRQLTPPPEHAVASATGKAKRDGRLGSRPFGPFNTHTEFHSLLRGHLGMENAMDTFVPKIAEVHTRDYKTMFAHADICMRNVMVRNGKVVGLIDWAFAGWYPEYWEYTKLHYGQLNVPEWYEALEAGLTRYDEELEVERSLWSKLDWPADQVEDT